jgi:hypothetical protein
MNDGEWLAYLAARQRRSRTGLASLLVRPSNVDRVRAAKLLGMAAALIGEPEALSMLRDFTEPPHPTPKGRGRPPGPSLIADRILAENALLWNQRSAAGLSDYELAVRLAKLSIAKPASISSLDQPRWEARVKTWQNALRFTRKSLSRKVPVLVPSTASLTLGKAQQITIIPDGDLKLFPSLLGLLLSTDHLPFDTSLVRLRKRKAPRKP